MFFEISSQKKYPVLKVILDVPEKFILSKNKWDVIKVDTI